MSKQIIPLKGELSPEEPLSQPGLLQENPKDLTAASKSDNEIIPHKSGEGDGALQLPSIGAKKEKVPDDSAKPNKPQKNPPPSIF
ncbi:MAG: hypothetical protein QXY90_05260 [Candidatus Anstonellales archaeon]